MTLTEARIVAQCVSRTAVSSGIMCDIMEGLNEFFPQFEFYVSKTGQGNICVKYREQEE